MPKTFKPKEVIAKFKHLGFIEDRQRVVVPYHLKEIPKGTLTAILRESKVTKTEFEKA